MLAYAVGPLGDELGAQWTLLESGSWVSPTAWHSMDGANQLVCDLEIELVCDLEIAHASASSAPAAGRRRWQVLSLRVFLVQQ